MRSQNLTECSRACIGDGVPNAVPERRHKLVRQRTPFPTHVQPVRRDQRQRVQKV